MESYYIGNYDGALERGPELLPRRNVSKITIGEIIESYRRFVGENFKQSHNRNALLRRIEEAWGDREPHEVTMDDVSSFRTERHNNGLKNSSINAEMKILSALFNYGNHTGRIDHNYNPCRFLRPLSDPVKEPVEISDDELIAICHTAPRNVKRAILIARYTGLRNSHVIGLRWEQIHNWVIYPTADFSSKRVGRVPVREELQPILGKKHEASGPVLASRSGKPRSVQIVLSKFSLRSIGREIGMHDLRYAFHTDLLRIGVPDAARRIMMGHGRDLRFSRSMVDRYVALTDDDLKRFIGYLPNVWEVVFKAMR